MPTSYETSALNPLVRYAVDYLGQTMSEFVAGQVAPPTPMGLDKGHYPVFNQWDSMDPDSLKPRAKGTKAARKVMEMSEDTYQTLPYDSRIDVDLGDLSNISRGEGMPDFERRTVHALTRNAMLKWESLFADVAFDTSVWGASSTYTGVNSGPTGNQFIRFDQSGSNCIDTFLAMNDIVFNRTGLRPTDIILAPDLMRYLLAKDTKLDGRISGIQIDRSTTDLAKLFQVKRVSRLSASKLSSNLGQTAKTFANFASNKAVILYADPTPSEFAPSAIRTFALNNGIYLNGVYSKSYLIDETRAQAYESGVNVDVKLTSAYLGIILDSCLATP